jgi:hypothetical protein
LGLPEYSFRDAENRYLTCFFLVPQDFPRILVEEPESFRPKRSRLDDEDPDPFTLVNVHKMGPTRSRRPCNIPAPRPANASDSDDDDCIMLEVLDPLSLSYVFFFVTPV